jgi:hypothetical protein
MAAGASASCEEQRLANGPQTGITRLGDMNVDKEGR